MRRLFNDGRFYERVQQGELVARRRTDRHPTANRANEPYCTRSQIVEYVDLAGISVALVHQYQRRDGTLGASGEPDPRWVVIDGVVYTKAPD